MYKFGDKQSNLLNNHLNKSNWNFIYLIVKFFGKKVHEIEMKHIHN